MHINYIYQESKYLNYQIIKLFSEDELKSLKVKIIEDQLKLFEENVTNLVNTYRTQNLRNSYVVKTKRLGLQEDSQAILLKEYSFLNRTLRFDTDLYSITIDYIPIVFEYNAEVYETAVLINVKEVI